MRLAGSVISTQDGTNRIESVMKSKQLLIHPDKSGVMPIAEKATLKGIQEEMKSHPVQYDDFMVKPKVQEKWLGEQMCQGWGILIQC